MVEVRNERDLNELFQEAWALLFSHADWSQYAVISKSMLELIERDLGVPLFCGQFENERLPLAHILVAAGVPGNIAFAGAGSVSLFQGGKHVWTITSVVGEGTWNVQRKVRESLENTAA
jgi:hypothetical protein